jgi:GNAT superfamily N-acetyltransferase
LEGTADGYGRDDLTPWLGGMWVAPQYRGRGIGTALCSVVEEKAEVLGYDELFLFTLDKQPWYSALNWSSLEPARWRGQPGTIMRKRLAA